MRSFEAYNNLLLTLLPLSSFPPTLVAMTTLSLARPLVRNHEPSMASDSPCQCLEEGERGGTPRRHREGQMVGERNKDESKRNSVAAILSRQVERT